jgi:hypothetical protein
MNGPARISLAPGMRVRHQYDGATGTVERRDPTSGMWLVTFADGANLVLPDDVRRIGRPVKKAGRR